MKEKCFHCGLDIPKDIHLLIHFQDQTHPACCTGCQVVAQSIIDAGLGHYYTQRTKEALQAILPPEDVLEQIKLYDLDEVQASFVEIKENHKKEALLIIEGITCAACVWLIEQRLLRLPGVVSVDLNFSNHRARIQWDDSQVKLSVILNKISQTGYQAHPYDAARFEEQTQKERKKVLTQLWVAGLSMMQVMMYAIPIYMAPEGEIEEQFLWMLHWTSLILTLPVMLYSAIPFYKGTLRDLKNKRVGMDTPVTIAILAAFSGSFYALINKVAHGVYFDSISMFVFLLLLGRYLESIARRKAGDATERLIKLVPAFCHKLVHYPHSSETSEALVAQLIIDDVILVKAGEVICADSIVLHGHSQVNEAMLTGESLPIEKTVDDTVTAGTLNINSPLTIKVLQVGNATRLGAIVRLLDQALSQKPKLAQISDRYAAWFVGSLLFIAVLTFIGWALYTNVQTALWVTVSLLVISCPCALSLATPAALAAATGNLAKKGLLTSKTHSLETLSKVSDIVFDKTGTLTTGRLSIKNMWFDDHEQKEKLLEIAALLESQSEHPIAHAFQEYLPESEVDYYQINNIIGQGICADILDDHWCIGRLSFVCAKTQKIPESFTQWQNNLNQFGTLVAMANKSGLQAVFLLTDTLKKEAKQSLLALKKLGINIHLLSGDNEHAAKQTAEQLTIEHIFFEATPEDKLHYIQNLQSNKKVVLMVGDGINDAPVLARADVSIAMGSGADVALEGGDMVLLNDDLNILPKAWLLATKTRKIIKENLIWACVYNITAVPLAVMGMVNPWIAALGMALSSLLVVSNALRLLK